MNSRMLSCSQQLAASLVFNSLILMKQSIIILQLKSESSNHFHPSSERVYSLSVQHLGIQFYYLTDSLIMSAYHSSCHIGPLHCLSRYPFYPGPHLVSYQIVHLLAWIIASYYQELAVFSYHHRLHSYDLRFGWSCKMHCIAKQILLCLTTASG